MIGYGIRVERICRVAPQLRVMYHITLQLLTKAQLLINAEHSTDDYLHNPNTSTILAVPYLQRTDIRVKLYFAVYIHNTANTMALIPVVSYLYLNA